MPHKHKRRQKDDNDYDLPPSTIAKPLPARQDNAASKKTPKDTKKAKRVKTAGRGHNHDTPREFARMMTRFTPASHTTSPSGPEQQSRKRKRDDHTEGSANATRSAVDGPRIIPGERMSDFGARVDQALPLSGISKKAGNSSTTNSKDAAVRKLREERQTRHERKLRRLQQGWRAEETRLREKEAEEKEQQEEEQEEMDDLWKIWEEEAGGTVRNKKKKGKVSTAKRKRKGGNAADEDEGAGSEDEDGDPWAELNRKAHSGQPSNPFDVVQAPPGKLVKPKEKFKVRGMGGAKVDVANVPAAAGSLRRREELASERQTIVEQYRKLMAEKRG